MSIENRKIIFERGKILNVDMLKELQESAKDYLRISYYSYSDGIIEGFNFKYDKSDNLKLTPGILKYNEEFYILRNEITIKTKEDFKKERREGSLFITLMPEVSKIENSIEIKGFKVEISEELIKESIFLGSFVDRVNYPPKVDYEKIESLNDKTYINILDRVYGTMDGEAMTPWIGKLLLERFMKKTTLSPGETYFFNRGIENKPIPKKFISEYLGNTDIEKFLCGEILSKILDKIGNRNYVEKVVEIRKEEKRKKEWKSEW
ncbi:hypothetical protein ACQ9ZF_11020 (plasmid) [Cetobacterium somerae]|uniref:hypothetical protein n=1 Tax=Cetobacterium somerae TaxID=188913 RepID=UPI003D767B3D